MQNPFLLVIFSLFCGVTIPPPAMPHFWKSWMYPLDPFTRIISGMVSTELHQLPITCLEREFYTFNPPTGQTCLEWAGDFVSTAGGYLLDENATDACKCESYSLAKHHSHEFVHRADLCAFLQTVNVCSSFDWTFPLMLHC